MRATETESRGDHRGVAVCAVLAVVAVVVGVGAVVADEAVLGLVAAVVGVAAAGVGALVDVHRTRAEESLWEARSQARRLRRQLDLLQAAVAEEQRLTTGGDGPSIGDPSPGGLPEGSETGEWEIDPVSGLLRERHLPVLLQQVVAAARRKVLPVAVIFWELDGLAAAPPETCDQALTALGAVAWRTLRESDAVFRLGDVVAVAVLVDTAEPGAVIVAGRVRDALRSSPVGDSLTVSAGIACYPTHALDAAELVARAGTALEAARGHGHDRDHVAVAAADTSD
jgi:diguanylate cyclase (GGDEF)-like protein